MKSSKFTSTPLFPRQALVALLLPLIAEQALSAVSYTHLTLPTIA